MQLNISTKFVTPLIILGVLSLTIYAYFPGLLGGYLLDDLPNLSNIAVYSRFEGFDAIIRYICSYDAGPLKRPISTLSFLLNTTTLTVNAFNFKVTNLAIHLLNGLLLYIVTLKILKVNKTDVKFIQFIAITNMAIWLLHPFFVSTTLYVIQRMAMLPVTFVLLGMYFYIKGRESKCSNNLIGTIYIVTGVYFFTLLAVLSKENGIILPILIVLLESYVISRSNSGLLNFKLKFIIYFPVIIIGLSFLLKFPGFIEEFTYRDFTLLERLLTESRILVNYLFHLFIPKYQTAGVFTDGYLLSQSLINPISTFFSIGIIFLIVTWSIIKKNKQPLVGFAILFYFCSHIIESTFVPLELYFEHRNYLPSLFLFLPIPFVLVKYFSRYKLNYIVAILVIGYVTYLCHTRAIIWSDTKKLFLLEKHPNSIRALEMQVTSLYKDRNENLAIKLLEDSILLHPNVSLRINLINLKCAIGEAETSDFINLNTYIGKYKLTRHDAASISGLLNVLINTDCLANNYKLAQNLIITIKKKKGYNIPKINKVVLSSEIYLGLKLNQFELSYNRLIKYLYKYYDFFDVIKMIRALIEKNDVKYSLEAASIVEGILLENKHRYTDRDYLSDIRLIKQSIITIKK